METLNDKAEAFYGLPAIVEYCTRCVVSNQRPNSSFEYAHGKDSKKTTIAIVDGVCDACKFSERKSTQIDWQERDQELRELSARFSKHPGRYNCLVPGSGGKDSFYQSHVLKYKYGFRPLTVTWAPHIYTDWGWKNFQSWIGSGFDNYLVTPNAQVHRLLTRLAVENLFHPFQPFIIGQKAVAPKLAETLDIPLVFYGENEAEYGNPIADTNSALRDFKYFTAQDASEIFISGTSLSSLESDYGIEPYELQQYLPANPEALNAKGIEIRYLGYYLNWHPQAAYYYAVEHGGFIPSPERNPGTYSKYHSLDDKVDDLHWYTTFIKFGIGRATFDAAQEIRNSDITREEGVALVKKFDGEWPARFEQDLMSYLSVDPRLGRKTLAQFEHPEMTKAYFLEIAEKFRSPHLWRKSGDEWILKHQVS